MIDVWIGPGHGRRADGTVDPGATAGSKTEQSEGDLVVGHATAQLRDRYGLEVYRQPRGGPNFAGSIDEINRMAPRCAVEVHHDWSGAPRGGFGFHSNAAQKRLADAILVAYRNAGLPTRAHMTNLPGTTTPPAIIRRTTPTTVLWEVDRIGSVTNHAAYGRAIADGIAVFLGAAVVNEPVPQPVSAVGITYHRHATPTLMRCTEQPTTLHDFSPSRWQDMAPVRTFDRGDILEIVGEARHPVGSTYYMTGWSFADADVTGNPRATNGINRADLEAIPDDPEPQPEPQPEPEPQPDPEPETEPVPQPDPVPVDVELDARVTRLEHLLDPRGVVFDLMAPLNQPDGTRPLNRDRGRIIVGPFERANGFYNYSDSALVQGDDRGSDPWAQQDGHVPYYSTAKADGTPGAARWCRPHATINVQVPFSLSLTARIIEEPAGANDGLKVAFLHESNESMWLAQVLRKDRRANLFQEDRGGHGVAADTQHGKVWVQTDLAWLVGRKYRIDIETALVRNPITGARKILIEVFVDGARILHHKTREASRAGQVGLRADNTWAHLLTATLVQR